MIGWGGDKSGAVIQVENYIVNLDCGRDIDVDLLSECGGAGVDLGFRPAKYRVSRPAAGGRRDENDTVNVYPSGKLVCLGAKSAERVRTDMRMVLRRLGAGGGGGHRTPPLCRGPTVQDVGRVVGGVYRMIVQSDRGTGGDGAGEADGGDDVRPPSV